MKALGCSSMFHLDLLPTAGVDSCCLLTMEVRWSSFWCSCWQAQDPPELLGYQANEEVNQLLPLHCGIYVGGKLQIKVQVAGVALLYHLHNRLRLVPDNDLTRLAAIQAHRMTSSLQRTVMRSCVQVVLCHASEGRQPGPYLVVVTTMRVTVSGPQSCVGGSHKITEPSKICLALSAEHLHSLSNWCASIYPVSSISPAPPAYAPGAHTNTCA